MEQAQGAVSLCSDELDVLRPFEVFTEYDAEVLGLLHVFENDSVEGVEFGQLGLRAEHGEDDTLRWVEVHAPFQRPLVQ